MFLCNRATLGESNQRLQVFWCNNNSKSKYLASQHEGSHPEKSTSAEMKTLTPDTFGTKESSSENTFSKLSAAISPSSSCSVHFSEKICEAEKSKPYLKESGKTAHECYEDLITSQTRKDTVGLNTCHCEEHYEAKASVNNLSNKPNHSISHSRSGSIRLKRERKVRLAYT